MIYSLCASIHSLENGSRSFFPNSSAYESENWQFKRDAKQLVILKPTNNRDNFTYISQAQPNKSDRFDPIFLSFTFH